MLFSIVVGFFEKFVYEGLGGAHNDEPDAKKVVPGLCGCEICYVSGNRAEQKLYERIL